MLTKAPTLKEAVLEVLDELPEERIAEVLDFAVFLKMRKPNQGLPVYTLPTVPASQLASLAGMVAWGGDAVADTERLYEL